MAKYEIEFPAKCKLCGFIANRLDNLRLHIQRKDHGMTYSEYMDKFYGVSVVAYKRKHRGVDLSECFLCGKKIKSLSGLATHLSSCHPEIDYEKYMFDYFGISIYGDESEKVECKVCGKLFLNLAKHIRNHGLTKIDYEKRYGNCVFQKQVVKSRVVSGLKKHSQRMSGLTPKQRFKVLLGEDLGENAYREWRDKLAKIYTLDWFIDKNGDEEGRVLYKERSNRLRELTKDRLIDYSKSNSVCWSMVSQELFWKVYGIVKNEVGKVYFGELNHEYSCGTSRNFDFVAVDKKKVIEFNGEKFHPNPILSDEEKKEWVQLFTGKSASVVDEDDSVKQSNVKSNGYKFLIVWESEYKKKPEEIVEKCVRFLRDRNGV